MDIVVGVTMAALDRGWLTQCTCRISAVGKFRRGRQPERYRVTSASVDGGSIKSCSATIVRAPRLPRSRTTSFDEASRSEGTRR
jgi:hypothetical protein